MFLDGHYQNAYITRDLDRALTVFRTQYGIDNFQLFDGPVDVTTPKGKGEAVNKIALGWAGNLQYELIEPVSGLVDVYRDALPADHSLRFHHICMRVHDWNGLLAEIERQKRPVVYEGIRGDHLRFLYVDARDSLGHYLEYVWMRPEVWAAMGGR